MTVVDLCMKYVKAKQRMINERNRSRLNNLTPTIVSSNCFGGILYHWLGLRFNSLFINLFLTPDDFLFALEHWDEFISTPVVLDTDAAESYPVGVGFRGIRIHFMHYASFAEAIEKWNLRMKRIDMDNFFVILSNSAGGVDTLERFSKLPFTNKIVFTEDKHPDIKCCVYLPGYKMFCHIMRRRGLVPNVWMARSFLTGKRFVDSFDYIKWLNRGIM